MRLYSPKNRRSLSSALLLLPTLASALSIDCGNIRVDDTPFNLEALGGPHSVSWVREHPPAHKNTTYTLDICRPLKREGDKNEECSSGTHVCGIERTVSEDGTSVVSGRLEIAGQYTASTGGALDPKWTRLKTSSSNADSQLEGLDLVIHGKTYEQKHQKAIIRFLCLRKDKDFEKRKREDSGDDRDDKQKGWNDRLEVDDGNGGRLKFLRHQTEGDDSVLRLEWKTEFACEDAVSGGGSGGKGGWGFFSWFFFIIFFSLAAYLIFGSWLNYSRYGARGWDLVPHGDVIQDLPYILRDWFRKVIDTVQGGHSRGGYTAV